MNKSLYCGTSLLFLCLLTLGCQVTPKLMSTPSFEGQHSQFYVHTSKQSKNRRTGNKHVFIDNVETHDFDTLDKLGVPLQPGSHSIKILDEDKDLTQKIEYKALANKEYHLIYCEEDGSVHSYTFEKGMGHKEVTKKSAQICRTVKDDLK